MRWREDSENTSVDILPLGSGKVPPITPHIDVGRGKLVDRLPRDMEILGEFLRFRYLSVLKIDRQFNMQ